jgi:hypothetical protein
VTYGNIKEMTRHKVYTIDKLQASFEAFCNDEITRETMTTREYTTLRKRFSRAGLSKRRMLVNKKKYASSIEIPIETTTEVPTLPNIRE